VDDEGDPGVVLQQADDLQDVLGGLAAVTERDVVSLQAIED
jgi:hypothetical protein